jgi:hypothetical protein
MLEPRLTSLSEPKDAPLAGETGMVPHDAADLARLKPSSYNLWREAGGRIPLLLFNTLTCAVAEITPAEEHPLRTLLASRGMVRSLASLPDATLGLLVDNGFLVDMSRDEWRELQYAHDRQRLAPGGVGLTIMPTMRCNCACRYCYEEARDMDMSPEIEDAIVDWLQPLAQAQAPYELLRWEEVPA